MDQKRLAEDYPALNVLPDRRFVENGRIITSGGISAGIDMSLQLVSKYISPEVAGATAKRLEYSAGEEVFYPS
jgi:transcriptional regulator GlxA family with amidase domain